jgi:hypothetical protein
MPSATGTELWVIVGTVNWPGGLPSRCVSEPEAGLGIVAIGGLRIGRLISFLSGWGCRRRTG